ncbi:adenine deaminase [Porcincola sp. LCP21S3_C12]|uniref:adenine deaminase n=1 Tax=Porcincola sp. LCP21S3_C12 TaxID=3438798 RepID=UPI003F9DDC1F
MDKKTLIRVIDSAMHRVPADLVIYNCQIVDVFTGTVRPGSIAITDGLIVGFGDDYRGQEEIDAGGAYAAPGLIDGHIHIESTYTSPEEFGRMVVPRGTTTVIADPHEITNVYGLEGLNYMIRAASRTELSVRYMIPSCVPATPFEDAGAVVNAFDMQWPMQDRHVPGLGEFMNVPGILEKNDDDLNKLLVALSMHKVIDGHSPGLEGAGLNAYIAAGVKTDHECTTVKEMEDRLERGMYVQLRDGSACHDLENLIPGITPYNYRRLILCSDDRQPKTILNEGHIDSHLRKLVKAGIDPVMAICMATLNAAECYKLEDRGALAPGRRADIVLFDNLKDFGVKTVLIEGKKVAENGRYLLSYEKAPIYSVRGSMHVKAFTEDDLRLHLKSDFVKTIEIIPGGIRTKETDLHVKLDTGGDFVFEPGKDVAKIAVLERHHNTGRIGLGLLKGYGIQQGAVALSVAHDSHNIICVGVSNTEMSAAIHALIDQEGGFVLVKDGKVIASLPLPIAGLMSDRSGEEVAQALEVLHNTAYDILGVSHTVEPIMTLCFMSLIVIPDIKITDRGLFDMKKFAFTKIEAENAGDKTLV